MSEILNPINIIFLVIIVIIFFRLRQVLGRRTGHERPPVDPYSASSEDQAKNGGAISSAPDNKRSDNVIGLPTRATGKKSGDETAEEGDISPRFEKLAPKGTPLHNALREIFAADRYFDPEEFLEGATKAYEMIVTAFAEGDRKTLKPLLSDEVYQGFDDAITQRDKDEMRVKTTFVGIGNTVFAEAGLKDKIARISVRFESDMISATLDKDDNVVDGDESRVNSIVDIWTFAREVSSNNPNWKLIATEFEA